MFGDAIVVAGQQCTDEGQFGAVRNGRAGDPQVRDDVAGTPRRRHARRASGRRQRRQDVHPVADQQPRPAARSRGRSPTELPGQHLRRRLQRRPAASGHGPLVVPAEAELEQQLQMIVVRPEHPVVQRLSVVGIGAGGSNSRASGSACGCRGCLPGPCSPSPNTPVSTVNGRQPEPQVAGVRVGTGVEQQSRAAQEPAPRVRRAVHPGVRQVQQRRPTVRPGRPGRRPRVGRQVARDRVRVGRGRRRGDAAATSSGCRGQQLSRARPTGPARPVRCRPGRPAGRTDRQARRVRGRSGWGRGSDRRRTAAGSAAAGARVALGRDSSRARCQRSRRGRS